MKTLYTVIPCFNEEEVLPETIRRIGFKYQDLVSKSRISKQSKVVFVDDGSKDQTWNMITKTHQQDDRFLGVKLSRNRGHQNALLAGLTYAKEHADIIISMDADLQDDIDAIDAFIDENDKGMDIVYGVRNKREKDTFFKRFTAESFYKFMRLMGVDIIFNHADYRLMSQRALKALDEYEEVNLFLRGIVPTIGFPSSRIFYDRDQRFAGESKYPLKKMLAFAFEGITSFSIRPIRMILSVAFFMFFVSIIIIVYSLYRHFIGATVTGWTFLNISLWLIAGIQTMLLGIVGEYIGKIYNETKKRPRYIIDQIIE